MFVLIIYHLTPQLEYMGKDQYSCAPNWASFQQNCPFSSPGDLPDPGIEPRSPALQADSVPSHHQESPKLSQVPLK